MFAATLGWLRLPALREFGKEAPLRKELVLHNVRTRTGTRMRTIAEFRIREVGPHRDHLIRLAGVSLENMLEQRNPRARNLQIRNRRGRIFHRGAHDSFIARPKATRCPRNTRSSCAR